jgi:hypothetical protein
MRSLGAGCLGRLFFESLCALAPADSGGNACGRTVIDLPRLASARGLFSCAGLAAQPGTGSPIPKTSHSRSRYDLKNRPALSKNRGAPSGAVRVAKKSPDYNQNGNQIER